MTITCVKQILTAVPNVTRPCGGVARFSVLFGTESLAMCSRCAAQACEHGGVITDLPLIMARENLRERAAV